MDQREYAERRKDSQRFPFGVALLHLYYSWTPLACDISCQNIPQWGSPWDPFREFLNHSLLSFKKSQWIVQDGKVKRKVNYCWQCSSRFILVLLTDLFEWSSSYYSTYWTWTSTYSSTYCTQVSLWHQSLIHKFTSPWMVILAPYAACLDCP